MESGNKYYTDNYLSTIGITVSVMTHVRHRNHTDAVGWNKREDMGVPEKQHPKEADAGTGDLHGFM